MITRGHLVLHCVVNYLDMKMKGKSIEIIDLQIFIPLKLDGV